MSFTKSVSNIYYQLYDTSSVLFDKEEGRISFVDEEYDISSLDDLIAILTDIAQENNR